MIKEYKILTPKTARYFMIGKADQKVKKIWFVFHGYGQLAKEFIENFRILLDEKTIILAIEAMNKFYLHGFYGKIGASWMTKEDRKSEINDYINLIDSVYNEVMSRFHISEIEVFVLGFSQGTHTAVRWLSNSKIKVQNLILWSGTFPHDCSYKEERDYWAGIKKKIVLGTKDKLINKEKLETELNYLKNQNLNVDLVNFDGGHEIGSDLLKYII